MDALRPLWGRGASRLHSHAERGNDHYEGTFAMAGLPRIAHNP